LQVTFVKKERRYDVYVERDRATGCRCSPRSASLRFPARRSRFGSLQLPAKPGEPRPHMSGAAASLVRSAARWRWIGRVRSANAR